MKYFELNLAVSVWIMMILLLNNSNFVICQLNLYESISNSSTILRRPKRYLDFTKGSRMSWRANVKNNILLINAIFGYAYGFRVNFPYPDKSERSKLLFKRDVIQGFTDILDGHGLDGQACILKSFCTAHLDNEESGMLFKLLKFIFTLTDTDKRNFPYLRYENCKQILHSHCPLSFNGISTFTDDV